MIDLWPIEHCDYLRELATDSNRSRAEMADMLNEKFGTSYTRNAVIGKCGRLGLCSPMPKRRGNAAQPKRVRAVKSPALVIAPPIAQVVDTRPRPEYGRFKLLDLREGDCRWPDEGCGPKYLFCGQPQWATTSYCHHHYFLSLRRPAA